MFLTLTCRTSLTAVTAAKEDLAARLEAESSKAHRLSAELAAAKAEAAALQQRMADLQAVKDDFERVKRSGVSLAAALSDHEVRSVTGAADCA